MLLANFKASLLYSIYSVNLPYFKLTNGEKQTISSYATLSQLTNSLKPTVTSWYSTPVFGNGKTPVTEYDYCLESKINTLTVKNVTHTAVYPTQTEDKAELYINITVANETNSPVTVSEIGMEYLHSSNNYILWYREVFDEITIAPNETKVFVIKRV